MLGEVCKRPNDNLARLTRALPATHALRALGYQEGLYNDPEIVLYNNGHNPAKSEP